MHCPPAETLSILAAITRHRVTKAGASTGLNIRCLEALRIVWSVREHVLDEAPQPLSDRPLGQIATLRALWSNVVHLQGAPLPAARWKSMPGPVAAAEREECAVRGHYLVSIIFHVIRRSENAKPTAWSGPMFIEVYQYRDYLGLRVSMYLSITPLSIFSNCCHPAIGSQIHLEFIRHSLTEIVTLKIADQVP